MCYYLQTNDNYENSKQAYQKIVDFMNDAETQILIDDHRKTIAFAILFIAGFAAIFFLITLPLMWFAQ